MSEGIEEAVMEMNASLQSQQRVAACRRGGPWRGYVMSWIAFFFLLQDSACVVLKETEYEWTMWCLNRWLISQQRTASRGE